MLSNFQFKQFSKFYKLHINKICMKDKLPNTVPDCGYVKNMRSSRKGIGTLWLGYLVYLIMRNFLIYLPLCRL